VTTLVSCNRALSAIPDRTPFIRPDAHLEKLGVGDTALRQGRRPSTLSLVDKLRAAVDRWRDDGYRGIVTTEPRCASGCWGSCSCAVA